MKTTNILFSVTLLFLGLFFSYNIKAQNPQEIDYIESGYYQLVYEANIDFLEGNENAALEKYKEAERRCSFINSTFGEMNVYATLLMKNKEFDKALFYMEKIAKEYGVFPAEAYLVAYTDSLLMNNLLTAYPLFNDSIAPTLMELSELFYTEERNAIIEELLLMLEKDQQIREELEYAENNSLDVSSVKDRMKKIDEENLNRMFEIINTYGFPNAKLYGMNNPKLQGLEVIFIHNFENEEMKELLLQYVRKGECSPHTYAFVIDKNSLETNTKYIYGIFDSVADEKIEDIENLDKRRQAIGMPTREIERKRNELIQKTYNITNEQ